MMSEPEFNGQAIIKVRFRNNPEYVKFRKNILKTDWRPGDAYPTWEEMKLEFHNVDDLNIVNRTVVFLLQNGFEVYSTSYKLEQQLAEEEHPEDDIEETEEELDIDMEVEIYADCEQVARDILKPVSRISKHINELFNCRPK